VFSAGKLALPPAADIPLFEVEAAPAQRVAHAVADSCPALSYPPAQPRAPPAAS
jgi:hypothetical protein